MANTPIPNLPAVIALTGAELLEVVQGGTSSRATAGQIAGLAGNNAFQFLEINSTVAITITQGSIEVYFDATGGEIDQALPVIATLAAYNRQWMRFWKVDASANAVVISSTDGFLGYSSPQTLSSQGESLTVEINTTVGQYLMP